MFLDDLNFLEFFNKFLFVSQSFQEILSLLFEGFKECTKNLNQEFDEKFYEKFVTKLLDAPQFPKINKETPPFQ